jgi:hypothetical protein
LKNLFLRRKEIEVPVHKNCVPLMKRKSFRRGVGDSVVAALLIFIYFHVCKLAWTSAVLLFCISLVLIDRYVLQYFLPGGPIMVDKYDDKISVVIRDEEYARDFRRLNEDNIYKIKFFSE